MGIKDRPGRRLNRLGIIRLGYTETKIKRRADGTEYEVTYPRQADHFVLADAPELAEIYGPQPRELDVLLPFPDVSRNFDSAYTVWAGGVLVCRGDGEFVDYATPFVVQEKKGRISVHNAPGDTLVSGGIAQVAFNWNGSDFGPGDHVACPGAAQDLYPHCATCKLSCVLKVMMADPRLFRFGYYQLATGSGRNYDTLMGTLEIIYQQAGKVSGIPFKLRLVEEQTTYQDTDGVRKKTTKWFLQLEPEPALIRALYARQARALMRGEPDAPALPEPEPDLDEVDFEAEDAAPPPFAEAGGPAEEPQPEEANVPHWIDNQRARARFWQWTRDELALSDADVYAALGVQHVHDYVGTMDDAKRDIEAWLELQRAEGAEE